MRTQPRIPDDMHRVLISSGLPWRIETGSRHFKVIVNDRMAAILPFSPHNRMMKSHAHLSAMGHVRRAIRKLKGAN